MPESQNGSPSKNGCPTTRTYSPSTIRHCINGHDNRATTLRRAKLHRNTVIVDKLTKFAIIIPTHTTLSQEGFAKLFVERVVNVYGLPEVIISDRDKRWATIFWKSVVSNYGS